MNFNKKIIVSCLVVLIFALSFASPAYADFCDPDGDGYASMYLCAGTDCDDNDPTVNPGAAEICDGLDNNCSGEADEGVLTTYYYDGDADGYGDSTVSTQACTAPANYVEVAGDCDDAAFDVNPGVAEVCEGSVDEDCDGAIDEGCVADDCDLDADGYQSNSAECGGTDCDDDNDAIHPGVAESCDGVDNDCDGTVDNGVQTTYYLDADLDGYGDSSNSVDACSAPEGYIEDGSDCDDAAADVNPGVEENCDDAIDNNCSGGISEGCGEDFCDRDGDGAQNAYCTSTNIDCDDNDASRYPGATEECDGIDNDCNEMVDDGLATVTYYQDADGDGFGDSGSVIVDCAQPDGYVEDATDCDDTVATTYPGAAELCDGVDNDCDSSIDEEEDLVYSDYYEDADADGYGNPDVTTNDCVAPTGYVLDNTDCDDTTDLANPGQTEACDDEIDNNCDGAVNEGCTVTACDADGDGFDSNDATCGGTDCDDSDVSVNPGATEICDMIDNNCNGVVDLDAVDATNLHPDADGDGFGDPSHTVRTCAHLTGFVVNAADCDDTDDTINPQADEVCGDGIDNNCNGNADGPESVDATMWYVDADEDGYGDPAGGIKACNQPEGFVSYGLDCDDSDASINPLATEICGDGVDNDCNAIVDESCYLDSNDDDGDGYSDYEGDCDDYNANIYPGATEVCDGLDNDCDGLYDDDDDSLDQSTASMWYVDEDIDGFGKEDSNYVLACVQPAGSYSLYATDCDDTAISTYPGATEICGDGVDNDCDGLDDTSCIEEEADVVPDDSTNSPFGEATGGGGCSLSLVATNPVGLSSLFVLILSLFGVRLYLRSHKK